VAQPIATGQSSVNPGRGVAPAVRADGRARAGVVLALTLAACSPIVERAAFSDRPDSLRAGDLLGPYDGQVLDAETDRPIGGALVAGSWAFERGLGLVGPAGAHEVVVETGADGRYRIPALEELPSGASTRIRRFTLIVYHRGHVGWRSDGRFPDGQARHDFSQRGNRVRLEKWVTTYPHHRHLVFLGGGEAIRGAAAWEIQLATLELEGRAPGSTGPGAGVAAAAVRPMDISGLLSEDEVRGVTGYPGKFDVGKLADLSSTEFYDSRHFKAVGKTESYDVALRVWQLGTTGAEAQYRKLLGQLPGASTSDEIGDTSLRARTGDVAGLAFLLRERGVVVSVTCGTAQCTDSAMLLRLAKLVESHLGDLPARPEPAKPEGEAPAQPPGLPVAPPSNQAPRNAKP
jgi:hypothetical protein